MAAQIEGIFDEETRSAVLKSKLLVVGAGGVGCELLKNLALTGFQNIHLITRLGEAHLKEMVRQCQTFRLMDLDTIDVSNLNRQFLFQKHHIGRPKVVVAKESVQKFNPKCDITTYHDSITNLKYNVSFYEQFSAVANALDNMAARKHVNRMCIAANVPLIESGSSGYLGQVSVHKKGVTECFECLPRPAPKDFPTCTIRNTPSETIHCVVWAKHLFNQLFGDDDPHQDVSPDSSELAQSENSDSLPSDGMKPLSTREKAKQCEYDPHILFKKLFHDDINYLLEMKHLWENRKPPTPLLWEELPDAVAGSSGQVRPKMKDQELWSIKECANVFKESLAALKKKVDVAGGSGILVWDKDDKHCMDFVAACANMRAYCFTIPQECRFRIKSMAGNIIPAIATTNAIIAGLIVLQLLKILRQEVEKTRMVILNSGVTETRKNLISSAQSQKPNTKCFVCSPGKPEVHVKVNIRTMTVKTLEEKVLIEQLNMIAPDVLLEDGKGTILISSDPEEKEGVAEKTLEHFGIQSGSRLQCDDFFQHFQLIVVIQEKKDLVDQDFEIIGDLSQLKAAATANDANEKVVADGEVSKAEVNDDNEIVMVGGEFHAPVKRKPEDENGTAMSSKRLRVDDDPSSSDEIITL